MRYVIDLTKALGSKAYRFVLSKGGPYIGPRGGKWANPQHTIPWKPTEQKKGQKHEKTTTRRNWIEHHPDMPMDTKDAHMVDGKFVPAREALHNRIVDDAVRNKKAPPPASKRLRSL